MPRVKQSDEELLEQIRADFRYCKEYWRENHEEAEKDMRFAACQPPPSFEADRKDRPCIWPDEISQYIKQTCNNLRQNKRSIKISPRSEDATDKDAEHRQAYIRGIEYASKAQSVYTTGFESAVQCGFGYWRVVNRITGPKGEQEPRLARIPNQFSVFPDPDAQEADFSDSSICFVLGPPMREKKFAQKFPNAKKRSFSSEDRQMASEWFHGDNVVPAEYWTREEVDEADGEKRYIVTQRITNGLEILEENEWPGSWIPIIGVFGEEKYVKNGGQVKRVFMSLIRRARDPQQMLAYIASQQAEEFGKAPSSPYLVIDGTIDAKEWQDAQDSPTLYLRYKIPVDWQPQWGPPPAPTRQPFVPNAQQYAVAYEQYRRSIMSSMGLTPLPTAAQRQNEKSGIALEKIQTQEAIGSFHFTDNFSRALANTGTQINELITKLAQHSPGLPQRVLGKDQKDEDVTLHVLQSDEELPPESERLPEAEYFFAHRGKFQETVSDGPSYLSQREESSAFADTLLQAMPSLGLPPQITQQVLAIAVKLKNIGTYGDEIADLLSPPDPNKLPPQMKAMLAQAQGQTQQLMAEIQQLRLEKLGKVTETEGKLAIAQQEGAIRMAEADKDRETKLAVAEVMTKAQNIQERMAAVEDLMKQLHTQAHEIAMAVQQQKHAQDLASQQAQIAAVQQPAAAANGNQAEPGAEAGPQSQL